ncbi:hypothetical protein [Candidatus Mesenet endosymbiont of Agriotes lineatus]|uniref:hypothetical protein n=1 Tax=Candidatus Mesenet endosymbiont of Agriotes lineatus TaxID=3077948 RepID=UPI0030D2F464
MTTENKKNKQSFETIDQISLPVSLPDIETEHVGKTKFVPIQPFRGKSRIASINSNSSTLSFDSFKDDATSLKSQRSESVDSGISSLPETSNPYSSNASLFSTESAAKNILTEEPFESFKNKGSHSFAYEGNVDDMLSSLASNEADRNVRALSSFKTFSDTELTSDEKISTNESRLASIKKPSIQDKPIKLARKVAPPTILTPKSSDANNSNLTSVIDENSDNILNSEKSVGEEVHSAKEILSNPEESLRIDRSSSEFTSLEDLMPLQEKVKEINRKDQLSSKVDKFISQVSVSVWKTVEERVKYGTFDTLKANVDRLNLKVNKVDSLLKNRSLIKVDKNNNSEVLLVTKKDIPLLKELKRDLKQELYEANKQLSKETKKILIYEQSKQQELQDKILKGDITKIEEAVSTAKSETDLKERSSLLSKLESDLKVAYSHLGKNLHPDLKSAITKLRKEKWASQTNIWTIKPDDTTKNYLPESRIDLTFAEKKEIFSRKRDVAKSLLDSQQYKGEDKEILKGLHKLYSNLAKSSEDKPKEKSNLEYAFKREFENAYKESCRTRLSEVSLTPLNQSASSLSK